MSDTSALKSIEDAVVHELLLVEGVLSSEAVPYTEAITRTEPDSGGGEFKVICKPPAQYPGAVVSLNDAEIDAIDDDDNQSGGTAYRTYRVPIYIAIYAFSDGVQSGSARWLVWSLSERAEQRLMVMTPAGLPDMTCMMGPLEIDGKTSLPVDPNTHGMLLKFWARYRIQAILTNFG